MSEEKPRRRRWGLISGSLSVLLTLSIVLGLAVVWGLRDFDAPGPLADDKVLSIAKGSGLADISASLEEEGVVASAWLFQQGVRLQGGARDLKAGEYKFPAGVTMRGAMEILRGGKAVHYALTLPEGLTSSEAVALVAAADAMKGRVTKVPPEGSLLPETYHYSRDETRQSLIERMESAARDTLAELWETRQADLPIETPEQALILASIVEKETGLADERPLVASVFINRLRKGMRLQSDPTVVYGITEGKAPLGRALTRADLKQPTPYNTYRIDGLPPTPIANPGRASITAVLQPAESDYIFFVADGTGGHAFARTLDEHNANVAEWRRIQQSQGDN